MMQIKNSWEQITLSEWQQIIQTQESSLDDLEKEIQIVQILTGAGREELRSLPISEYKALAKQLAFLEANPALPDLKETYTVGDTTYRLIREVQELTAGQFTDILALIKEPEEINEKLHQILAVLMIPVGKLKLKDVKTFNNLLYWILRKPRQETYLQTPFEVTAKNLLTLPVTEVLAISNFFTALWVGSQVIILQYLESQTKKKLRSVLTMLKRKWRKTDQERLLIDQIKLSLQCMGG